MNCVGNRINVHWSAPFTWSFQRQIYTFSKFLIEYLTKIHFIERYDNHFGILYYMLIIHLDLKLSLRERPICTPRYPVISECNSKVTSWQENIYPLAHAQARALHITTKNQVIKIVWGTEFRENMTAIGKDNTVEWLWQHYEVQMYLPNNHGQLST